MKLIIIGGGLAGCEAAWQAAERGVDVELYEMRPQKTTGAHRTDHLAELVCSNSLGSNLPNRASGLLKDELRRMGSLLIKCADASSLPAGGALAVDREQFSNAIKSALEAHPRINIIREEVKTIPEEPAIIATGPLTSPALSAALTELTGEDHMYFFDAIAPIIRAETIDMSIAFRANRYDKGEMGGGGLYQLPHERRGVCPFFRMNCSQPNGSSCGTLRQEKLKKVSEQGRNTSFRAANRLRSSPAGGSGHWLLAPCARLD